jgi:hypothetical protein
VGSIAIATRLTLQRTRGPLTDLRPPPMMQRPPEFLPANPLPKTRIKQIEGWLPEALTHYRPR